MTIPKPEHKPNPTIGHRLLPWLLVLAALVNACSPKNPPSRLRPDNQPPPAAEVPSEDIEQQWLKIFSNICTGPSTQIVLGHKCNPPIPANRLEEVLTANTPTYKVMVDAMRLADLLLGHAEAAAPITNGAATIPRSKLPTNVQNLTISDLYLMQDAGITKENIKRAIEETTDTSLVYFLAQGGTPGLVLVDYSDIIPGPQIETIYTRGGYMVIAITFPAAPGGTSYIYPEDLAQAITSALTGYAKAQKVLIFEPNPNAFTTQH